MHLKELINKHSLIAENTIPDWMIGCFKRRSISFANGQTDTQTHVFWLQGRNLTIDLRLPIEADWVTKQTWQQCSSDELYSLANYEGWSAISTWQNEQLSWSDGCAFQLHNRWPEPAILSRVGDCMMEASPYASYIEDWRIKSRSAGPLVSLELLSEENLTTGELIHKNGALIINGDWAGLVLGRSTEMQLGSAGKEQKDQLRDMVKSEHTNKELLEQIFNFETSVAQGNLTDGFEVKYSLQYHRLGQALFDLEGFEIDEHNKQVIQIFNQDKQQIKRRFAIDTLEPDFPYSGITPWHKKAQPWFDAEKETLGRYLEEVS